ncbi:3-hydroxyacyl-[acyl-carrier-protein] dehydratase FabZ [Caloramator mitchellensis]|uniref:3-hydroxyacyl-[acyl-carrier-protein] dehydratase FabZ n=1 Tax=Caloramator mitchellensis TaxID=908809 RepID=A0A0R3K638_CALMK|nr:3-hydroxyacyl-ACP dehydratase FabZ [Caloramator mitchellensis]KRQ87871.1 3-hydroxyacyl-[acyl-carrier-protein] dehydratase FabZ [Caloramator mitchellensis]
MIFAEDILKIVPHRYPFLLIDRIESITPGEKAVGIKCVSINEPFFQGHFPGKPVMPGVLIIEALAQVGAVAILSLDEYRGKIAYFTGINGAKFRRKVVPGDVLRLEVEIIKRRGPIGIGKAIAYVDDKKACEAEISFAIGLEE